MILATKNNIYLEKNEFKPNIEDFMQYIKTIQETEKFVVCIDMQKENSTKNGTNS